MSENQLNGHQLNCEVPIPKPRTIWTNVVPSPSPRKSVSSDSSTTKLIRSIKEHVNHGIDESKKSLRKLSRSISMNSSNQIDSNDVSLSDSSDFVHSKDFTDDLFDSIYFDSSLSSCENTYACNSISGGSAYDSPRSAILSHLNQDDYDLVSTKKVSTRSHSWAFYDSAANIYTKRNKSSSQDNRKVSKSTIYEFDPLATSQGQSEDENAIENEDIAMLENLLKQGLNFDALKVPEIPTKTDSLNASIDAPCEQNSDISVSNESKKKGWIQQILRKIPDTTTNTIMDCNPTFKQPALNNVTLVHHKGLLFKQNTGKEFFHKFSPYWCVLTNSKFTCFANIACESVKKNFDFVSISGLEIGPVEKTNDGDLYLFQITLSTSFKKRYTFGASTLSRRRLWMQKFAEAFTIVFPLKFLVGYIKIGSANAKNAINGEWSPTWLMLTNRLLLYQLDNDSYGVIDLRKAKIINLQSDSCKSLKNVTIFIDFQSSAIYLKMDNEVETKDWFQLIVKYGCENGANLDEQQLTKNDIPVVVEKCLNFIYANGLVSEGIYRRSGSETMINELLEKFRHNAWEVTLTPSHQNEHDVANVLRRFLRELPEPLLNSKDLLSFQDQMAVSKEKAILFLQDILDQLPLINLKTLKRIICHLNTVKKQSSRNLMTVENLASIWGPTLVRFDKTGLNMSESSRLSSVEFSILITLIENYENIFLISNEELEHERKIFECLESYWKKSTNLSNQNSLKIWIYNLEKLQPISIQISNSTSVRAACSEIRRLIELEKSKHDELIIEESIYDERLIRLLPKHEKLFDLVINWNCYFDEKTRKTNCLLMSTLSTNSRYKNYLDANTPESLPLLFELMMSPKNNKKFKKYHFELHNAFLKCSREKNVFYEWDLKTTKVYLGSVHSLTADNHWFVTLVGKGIHDQTKKNLFLSNSQCLCFTHEAQYKMFINFLLRFCSFEQF